MTRFWKMLFSGICLVLVILIGLYFFQKNDVKTIDYKKYIKLRSHQQFIDKLDKDEFPNNGEVYKAISNAESEAGIKFPRITGRAVIEENNKKKFNYTVKLENGKTKSMRREEFEEVMKEYRREESRNKKLQASNLATLLYLSEQKQGIEKMDTGMLCGTTFALVPVYIKDLIKHKETNNEDNVQQLIKHGIDFLETNSELFLNRCVRHSLSFSSYLTPYTLKQIYYLRNEIKDSIYKRWREEIIKQLNRSIEKLEGKLKRLKKGEIPEEAEIRLLNLRGRLDRSKKILKLLKKSKTE